VEEGVKKISPKTEVLKVITDVSDKSSVENLFNQAFKEFNEIHAILMSQRF